MTLITNNALTICITHHTHHHRFGVARQIRSFTFGLLLSLAKFSTLFGSFFPPSVVFGVQTDEEEAASTKTYYDHPYRAQSVIHHVLLLAYIECVVGEGNPILSPLINKEFRALLNATVMLMIMMDRDSEKRALPSPGEIAI